MITQGKSIFYRNNERGRCFVCINIHRPPTVPCLLNAALGDVLVPALPADGGKLTKLVGRVKLFNGVLGIMVVLWL